MTIFDRYFNPERNTMTDTVAKTDTDAKTDDKTCTGKITVVNTKKGYGFITSHDIPFTRIFFHWTSLIHDTLNFKELKVGMKVEFNPTNATDKDGKEKGIKAIRIRVVE